MARAEGLAAGWLMSSDEAGPSGGFRTEKVKVFFTSNLFGINHFDLRVYEVKWFLQCLSTVYKVYLFLQSPSTVYKDTSPRVQEVKKVKLFL